VAASVVLEWAEEEGLSKESGRKALVATDHLTKGVDLTKALQKKQREKKTG
jgi:hypothetical protein